MLLIHASYVVPVRPADTVLPDHAVAVENGRIQAVLPWLEAETTWPTAEVVALPGHVLLPGLVNAHTHAPMSLLRGYADDLELHVWLQDHIWPAEKKWVGPEFVAEGTRLAVAEMLRSGTTCFNDMYFYPDEIARVCLETGIRASVGIPLIEIPTAWAADIDACFSKGLEIIQRWGDESLLSFTMSPHAPYTVCDQTLERVSRLSREFDVRVHLHLLETKWEIKQSLQQHSKSPLARLREMDLINSRLLAVHMTQLSSEDIDQLAEAGVQVVHCPQSNLKLASGICPVVPLMKAGVNIAIGTDGAAANNDLDLLSEAQTAALLAKGISGEASAVRAFEALEMITINGATALGLEARIGSIEPGKEADLCALDLSGPETQPLHHVVSQVIYTGSGRRISDVWVAGRRLLDSGRLTTMDLSNVIGQAMQWKDKLSDRRSETTVRPGAVMP